MTGAQEYKMSKIQIEVPDVAHVIVTGPTQCGKSLVLARIERVLREEFGTVTVSRDLQQERNIGSPDTPADWELKMAAKTTWVLSEA
jgi:energy-coupling factor transporter ATP-binding protein EcfA2